MTSASQLSLLELVSARVGIVRELERISKGRREPEIPVIYRSLLANFDYRRADAADRIGAGKGETTKQAQMSAIGEALERYCSSQIDPSRLLRARICDLPAPALSPASLVLYAAEQYASLPYRPPGTDDVLTWICGSRPLNRAPIYLPASMVYMGYAGADMSETFVMPTSNGLAAGADLDLAVRAGILELVERDAFLLTWMNKLPAPQIDLNKLDGSAGQAVRHYARHGVDVRVFYLLNGFPIHACMAIGFDNERGAPAAVVGLSADLDPLTAVRRSIMELAQVRPGMVNRCKEQVPAVVRYEDIKSIEDHSTFFAIPEHLEEMAFLLRGDRHLQPNELANHATGSARTDIEKCLEFLDTVGIEVAYVDLTTSDLADFPVKVVRVAATKLQPMHFGFGNERLGGDRLFTIAQQLGFDNTRRTRAELNPCPHPLA